ncbi:hypothetical protein [Canibacter oris]|uniref:Helix-turn-helix domain-containing protein n=1 Tax=Canibacter oris TaxID=1365628 RepID=A0A840DK32_9MICO|nr:hypothetical protein [Canibacter oris]MBB4072075.1 hypothetical protein [Canibacter oris]
MKDQLLTASEATAIIGKSRTTFARAVEAGAIKPTYEPTTKTGARLYARQDVLKLKQQLDEKQKQKTTPTKNNKALAA